jgi:hypothetical protein
MKCSSSASGILRFRPFCNPSYSVLIAYRSRQRQINAQNPKSARHVVMSVALIRPITGRPSLPDIALDHIDISDECPVRSSCLFCVAQKLRTFLLPVFALTHVPEQCSMDAYIGCGNAKHTGCYL